jgi:hypothetical protein
MILPNGKGIALNLFNASAIAQSTENTKKSRTLDASTAGASSVVIKVIISIYTALMMV